LADLISNEGGNADPGDSSLFGFLEPERDGLPFFIEKKEEET